MLTLGGRDRKKAAAAHPAERGNRAPSLSRRGCNRLRPCLEKPEGEQSISLLTPVHLDLWSTRVGISKAPPAGVVASNPNPTHRYGISTSKSGAYCCAPNRSASPAQPLGRRRRMVNLIAFAGSKTTKSVTRPCSTLKRRATD